MSDQADLDEDRAIFERTPPIMLPPDAPESILLLLVISIGLTITLNIASLAHILGILILILVAKINILTFNPYALGLLAKIHCIRDATEACHHATQARLTGFGGQFVAWISGVRPEENVFDTTGAVTRASQQFQYRAGIIGAVATFVLVYKMASALYAKAYSIAKTSASIAELDVKPVGDQLMLRQPSTSTSESQASNCSNPLISPEDVDKQLTSMSHANPLKIPKVNEVACCTSRKALKIAQADWVEAVKQYGEASEMVLEENNGLRDQVMMLQQEISDFRDEAKTQYDRIEYLDVLLEEAGKQLGCETDVKDMLWKAYSRRRGVASTDEGSEEAVSTDGIAQKVEMTSSPPSYVEADEMKSMEAIIEEHLLHEA